MKTSLYCSALGIEHCDHGCDADRVTVRVVYIHTAFCHTAWQDVRAAGIVTDHTDCCVTAGRCTVNCDCLSCLSGDADLCACKCFCQEGGVNQVLDVRLRVIPIIMGMTAGCCSYIGSGQRRPGSCAILRVTKNLSGLSSGWDVLITCRSRMRIR